MFLVLLGVLLILVPFIAAVYFRLTNGRCRSDARLTGKTVLITGGTAGIGLEYLVDIARRDARIVIACRNITKGQVAAAEVTRRTGNSSIVVEQCDLSSFASVRECCERIREHTPIIDVFCCFAAAVGDAIADRPTEDGFETQFQCNYLSHLLMIGELMECFKRSPECRIIMTSSAAHMIGDIEPVEQYGRFPSPRSPFQLYGDSKLAMLILTRELASRFAETNITVNAFHPGTVHTDGIKTCKKLTVKYFLVCLSWIYGKTPTDGAQTMIHLTVAPDVRGISGLYWADCGISTPRNSQIFDDKLCQQLWQRSIDLVRQFMNKSVDAALDN